MKTVAQTIATEFSDFTAAITHATDLAVAENQDWLHEATYFTFEDGSTICFEAPFFYSL